MTRKGEMTLAKAAEIAGVSRGTLLHAIHVGKLAATRRKTLTGVVWLTTVEALDNWQRTRRIGRPPKKE